MKTFLIIDCNLGNLRNVQKVLEKLGEQSIISNKAENIKKADYLFLQVVGAFGDDMQSLESWVLI